MSSFVLGCFAVCLMAVVAQSPAPVAGFVMAWLAGNWAACLIAGQQR